LSRIAQLEWIVDQSIADTKFSFKAASDCGMSRGDAGKVASTDLFGGELFESRKQVLADMLKYMIKLPHDEGKPVEIGVILQGPGAGKSFTLQRAYETSMTRIASFSKEAAVRAAVASPRDLDFAALDACTMRLILSFNDNMGTDVDALLPLVARVLFTYFCGPSMESSSVLTRIGAIVDAFARLDALWHGVGSDRVLGHVLDVLEDDFASHRGVDAASVRTIFFVDEADEEKLAPFVVADASGTKTLMSNVRHDVCSALDRRIGLRGAIFTALKKQIPDFALGTRVCGGGRRPLRWFAVDPLPVRDIDVLQPFVVNALSKFGNLEDRLPHVMVSLALTGGHGRDVEIFLRELANSYTRADWDIGSVLDRVQVELTALYGSSGVQRWFCPSLLGAYFRQGTVEQREPFDDARCRGEVINTVAGIVAGVVPQVSLVRLGRLGDQFASVLFQFLTNTERLLAYQTNAVVFEQLIVATLPLKLRLVWLAVKERKRAISENERQWWPVPMTRVSDRLPLFRSVSFQLALFPTPSQTAARLGGVAKCATEDEVALGNGKMRIFHINESIWSDQWTKSTEAGDFDQFAGSSWVAHDSPIVVYTALPNQAATDVALLYKNTKGEARALVMQTKFSGLDVKTRLNLDLIIDNCKTRVALSKPLHDFGIVDMSQITVCILAHGKVDGANQLAHKCGLARVKFHVVLLQPDLLRDFFGPSLLQLPFFNNARGAESLWSDTQRALQDARAHDEAVAAESTSDCD
jgi:hypothetical protein